VLERILQSGICAAKIIRGILTGTLLLSAIVSGYGQPAPGEVFREFTFIPEHGHFGELDPACTREFTEEQWIRKPRMVMKSLDVALDHADKAEMSIEFWGGHIGTSQQQFRINQHDWMALPQPENTPTSPLCYHRTLLGNTSVKVPLEHLKNGMNVVQFTCGPQVCYNFNFGFYWIYSFTIRVYYDPSVQHTEGMITSPGAGDTLHDDPVIMLETGADDQSVKCIDFIGYYEDFDWEGNGVFRQWHYQTRYGEKYKHLGSVSRKPYEVTWNTRWLPDQGQPVTVAAIITDQNGVSYMTPEVTGIRFSRKDRRVVMYPSQDVPEAFGVRVGRRKTCSILVDDDLDHAESACILVSTWSGKCDDGSIHEIMINGKRVSDNFGRFHDYSFDYLSVPVTYISKGMNEISIHSRFEGHALEINWPGPVLLIEFMQTVN
jgi:hypothetical protein